LIDGRNVDRGRRNGRIVHVALVRQGPEEEDFDRRFWNGVDPDKKVEALWDMVLELRAWKGLQGDEPRLQRSVLRIQRP